MSLKESPRVSARTPYALTRVNHGTGRTVTAAVALASVWGRWVSAHCARGSQRERCSKAISTSVRLRAPGSTRGQNTAPIAQKTPAAHVLSIWFAILHLAHPVHFSNVPQIKRTNLYKHSHEEMQPQSALIRRIGRNIRH